LVFFGIIKFAPLTLLERGLIVGLSFALAWLTYRFVEIPFRFGRPSRLKIPSLCSGMVLVAVAGVVVVEARGFDFRLPVEIRDMANVPTQ
jgi:peptidoglycan/LPS O-acetylase OafA/YrhL